MLQYVAWWKGSPLLGRTVPLQEISHIHVYKQASILVTVISPAKVGHFIVSKIMFSGGSYSYFRSSSCQTKRSPAGTVGILTPEHLLCICPESLLTFLLSHCSDRACVWCSVVKQNTLIIRCLEAEVNDNESPQCVASPPHPTPLQPTKWCLA